MSASFVSAAFVAILALSVTPAPERPSAAWTVLAQIDQDNARPPRRLPVDPAPRPPNPSPLLRPGEPIVAQPAPRPRGGATLRDVNGSLRQQQNLR